MPGLSGVETLDALREINPDLPALMSSGYHRREVFPDAAYKKATGFLQKPYRSTELVEAVSAILHATRS